MSALQITVSDVALTSYWYVRSRQAFSSGTSGTVSYCTEPSLERCTRAFSLAGLPEGSVIHSAVLTAERFGDQGAHRSMDGSLSTGPVEVAPQRIIPGGTLEVEFKYRAAAVPLSEGYQSDTARWKQITLTVEYTGFTACTAPTDVIISQSAAPPGEEAVLSWSGAQAGINAPIRGYAVYRAESEGGEYTLLRTVTPEVFSVPAAAPERPGSFHFRIKTLSAQAGCNSALSAACASLSVQAAPPGKPTRLVLSPDHQYPAGEAVLSWNVAEGGENNPVTGYAVYASNAAEGPYEAFLVTDVPHCTVTAPQLATRYFRVLAVGRCLQGELSDECAGLTADLSGTSDFSVSASLVDAGKPLTVTPLSCADKAHVLTVSIGDFSDSVSAPANAPAISFTPPLAWLAAMPDAETSPMTLRLSTQGGGAIIKTVLLRCPDDVVPMGMSGSVTPVSPVVPSSWNAYVAGFSQAHAAFTVPGEAPYGASITEYRLEGPGVSLEGASLPLEGVTPILSAGDRQFILSATDTRGRTGKTVLSFTVHPYEPPALSGLLSVRALEDAAEDDEGTYIRCTARAIHSPCGGNNTVRCAVSYRRQGEETWQNAGEMNNGALLFGAALIALPDNWEIQCAVTDDLGGEQVYYDVVTRAKWEMHVKRGGGAWAFGGVADEDGALKVYGNVIANRVTALDGSLPLVSSGEWTPRPAAGSADIFTFSDARWTALGRFVTVTLSWHAEESHTDGPWFVDGLPFVWDQAAAGVIGDTVTGRIGLCCADPGSSHIRLYFISGQAGPPSAGHSGTVSISGFIRQPVPS